MTRANPKLTLTKDHLQKTKRGNVRKYKAATNAREGEQVPSSPTDEQLAALGIAAVPTPPSTPPLNFTGRLPGKPITRRDVPTCLDYGRHRRILYPGSLFCSPRDWYEQEVMLHNHNCISRKKGSRYSCQCNHVSFSEPAGSEYVPSPTSTSANSKVTILPTRYKLYDPKILLKTGSFSSLDNSNSTSTSTDNCDEEAEPNKKMNIPEINVSDADNDDSKPKALSPLESVKRNLLYNASLVVCEPVLLSHEETHVRSESYAQAVTNSMTSHHKCTPTTTESCGSFLPSQNFHTDVVEHKPSPESMLSAANTPEIDSQQASLTSHQDRTSSITTHLQQFLRKPSLNNAEEQDESPTTNSTTYINNEAVYAAAVAAAQAQAKDEKIIKLQQSLKRANKHIENLTLKIKRSESGKLSSKHSMRRPVREMKLYIDKQTSRKDRKTKHVLLNFMKELLSNKESEFGELMMTEMENCMNSTARQSIRRRYYNKAACLRKMDQEGHKISLGNFDQIRSLETLGKRYSREACLPSSGEIQKAQQIVDEYAEGLVKMKHGQIGDNANDEYIEFAADDLLRLIVDGFGLAEVAKERAVRINLSIDGAEISKHINHVTFGFKVSDVAAKCPITKKPLFLNSETATLQSRNLCVPVKVIMKKETTSIYSEFTELFHFFRSMSDLWEEEREGVRPRSSWQEAGYKPIKLALNMDMSATWKLFGLGGGAKNAIRPCHCCAIKSDNLVVPNATLCAAWCIDTHVDEQGWKCYHQPFLSDDFLAESAVEFDEVKRSLGEVIVTGLSLGQQEGNRSREHQATTRCLRDEDPSARTANAMTDCTSIHFDYGASTVSEKQAINYSELIDQELEKRELTSDLETMEERRALLLQTLIMEYKYKTLQEYLQRGSEMSNSAILFVVLDAVPCVLHMENRIGLKFFDLMLSYGLSQAKAARLYQSLYPRSAVQRVDKFIADVESAINTTVIGRQDRPTQWQCPVEGDNMTTKQIGTICLDNNKTRKVVENFDQIINICVPQRDIKEKWHDAIINNYVPAMRMLRRKEEFSVADIRTFQALIDKWFQVDVELTGLAGATNYIHLLSSGHISRYLRHWRSLYPHSQQGWEGMNALIKLFYFRRTQRGGSSGRRGEGVQSRIVAVGKWLLRKALWATGISYEEMDRTVMQQRSHDQAPTTNAAVMQWGGEHQQQHTTQNSEDSSAFGNSNNNNNSISTNN